MCYSCKKKYEWKGGCRSTNLLRSNIECYFKETIIPFTVFLLHLMKTQSDICKNRFLMGTVKLTSSSLTWRTCVKVISSMLSGQQVCTVCKIQVHARDQNLRGLKEYTNVKLKKR